MRPVGRTFEQSSLFQFQGLYVVTEQVHLSKDEVAKAMQTRYRSKRQTVSLVVVMDKEIHWPGSSSNPEIYHGQQIRAVKRGYHWSVWRGKPDQHTQGSLQEDKGLADSSNPQQEHPKTVCLTMSPQVEKIFFELLSLITW